MGCLSFADSLDDRLFLLPFFEHEVSRPLFVFSTFGHGIHIVSCVQKPGERALFEMAPEPFREAVLYIRGGISLFRA